MLSSDRVNHMLTVACSMYSQAKSRGLSENECRQFFLVGFIHDIGYEWGDNEPHVKISKDLMQDRGNCKEAADTVGSHGCSEFIPSDFALILNIADMTISNTGTSITLDERIESIKSRYDEESKAYKEALKLSNRLRTL